MMKIFQKILTRISAPVCPFTGLDLEDRSSFLDTVGPVQSTTDIVSKPITKCPQNMTVFRPMRVKQSVVTKFLMTKNVNPFIFTNFHGGILFPQSAVFLTAVPYTYFGFNITPFYALFAKNNLVTAFKPKILGLMDAVVPHMEKQFVVVNITVPAPTNLKVSADIAPIENNNTEFETNTLETLTTRKETDTNTLGLKIKECRYEVFRTHNSPPLLINDGVINDGVIVPKAIKFFENHSWVNKQPLCPIIYYFDSNTHSPYYFSLKKGKRKRRRRFVSLATSFIPDPSLMFVGKWANTLTTNNTKKCITYPANPPILCTNKCINMNIFLTHLLVLFIVWDKSPTINKVTKTGHNLYVKYHYFILGKFLQQLQKFVAVVHIFLLFIFLNLYLKNNLTFESCWPYCSDLG
ncbi:putative ORFan [Tupanvirus deep ocean]|uniref:ORFan n=2 Tax=Tupanvirus TaxID=2094720 RepID=A0AC62A8L0_9VIRU|nr:putative ORFan [Tupanvirus deep ocean]QKU34116.1 putative ORFan [Tupanvirus deep ocean]